MCKCNELVQLKEFGSFGHYKSTNESMENNVLNGFFKKIGQDEYEKQYQCRKCGDLWILGIPDYPVKGYFFRNNTLG